MQRGILSVTTTNCYDTPINALIVKILNIPTSTVYYNTLQYITIHYNTLQYITVYYNTLQYIKYMTIHYNILQCITIYYNTLQYKF